MATTEQQRPTAVDEGIDAAFLAALVTTVAALLVPSLRGDFLIVVPLVGFSVAFLLRGVYNHLG
jgi:hypothetical protein